MTVGTSCGILSTVSRMPPVSMFPCISKKLTVTGSVGGRKHSIRVAEQKKTRIEGTRYENIIYQTWGP